MAEFWATSGLDLLVETRWAKRRSSLEDSLRRAIQSGRLPNGTRLPSSRALAQDLGWSRGTVAAAYDQLVAEGYLIAQRGSGTRVALSQHATSTPPDLRQWSQSWRYDLRPGTPSIGSFPVAEWMRHLREAVRSAPQSAFGYGDPAGTVELRTAIAGYLGRVRGVQAAPANVVVCAGATQALSLLGGVLPDRFGPVIGAENPGFWFHRAVLSHSGLRVAPIPVDHQGADPAALAASGARAVMLTPSHQYPTGVTMAPARRKQFVAWARDHDGLVIEDDYDGELRYDRRPIAALQGIASDRVIYLGTASKTLGPALRLGWLVVPDALVAEVVAAQHCTLHSVEVTNQLGLAHLIDHHAYDQRVRIVRNAYRRRFQQLADLVGRLAAELPGLRLGGISAGGQAPLYLPADGPGEQAVLDHAAARELGLEALAVSSHIPGSHPPGLLIGFSRPAEHLYVPALQVLAQVLRHAARSHPAGA